MIKRLKLTEDTIKLLKFIRFEEGSNDTLIYVGKTNPYLLSGMLEDIARLLGYMDKAIPGTEDDAEGAAFPDNVEDYLLSVHHYVIENMLDFENLIHQYAFDGGLKPGTYKCIDTENIWSRE